MSIIHLGQAALYLNSNFKTKMGIECNNRRIWKMKKFQNVKPTVSNLNGKPSVFYSNKRHKKG